MTISQNCSQRLRRIIDKGAGLYLLSFLFLALQAFTFITGSKLLFISLGIAALVLIVLILRSESLIFGFFSLNALGFFLPSSILIQIGVASFLAVSALLYFSPDKQKLRHIYRDLSFLGLLLIGIFLSMIHSAWQGSFSIESFVRSFYLVLFFCSFFLFLYLLNIENYRRIVYYFIGSGVLFLVVFYFLASFMLPEVPGRLSIRKMVHPNQLTMYLEFFYPLVLFLALKATKPCKRLLYILLTLIFIVTILLTYSRGGLITIFVCFAYVVLSRLTVKKVFVILILGMALAPFFYRGFYERSSSKSVDNLISAGTRLELQKTGIKMILSNYVLFGYGLDEFHLKKFEMGVPLYLDPLRAMSTHNVYLELLLGMGLLGFLGVIGLTLHILWGLVRLKTNDMEDIRLGLIFCILSFLTHGLLDSNLLGSSFVITFFCILAFGRFLINNFDKTAPKLADKSEILAYPEKVPQST